MGNISEARMLHEHGTLLTRLKASNIVQAAEADLRLRERKKAKQAEPEELYSFARKHVQRARSAAHLIALAYFENDAAASTNKPSTYIVYEDIELLRETLVELLQNAVPWK